MSRSRTGAYQLLHCLHQPPFTPCKCVSVNVRVQLPSDVLKMHQSQTGSPELEGIHPRYVVYLVVVCCAGCNPFALIADVKDRSDRRDRGLQSAMCHRTPHTGWQGQLASIPQTMTPASISHYTASLFTHTQKKVIFKLNLCECFLWVSSIYFFADADFCPFYLLFCPLLHFLCTLIRFPGYDKSWAMYSFWSWNKVSRSSRASALSI